MSVPVFREPSGGSPAPGGIPLSGMAVMYLLMSAFHAAPWLSLIAKLAGDPEASSPVKPRTL